MEIKRLLAHTFVPRLLLLLTVPFTPPVLRRRDAGYNFMAVHPRYNLLTNNCQNLVETMVRLLCDGKMISQAMLNEELSLISPKIARDLMVARLRSKLDASNENEEPDDVKEDVDVIKAWLQKIQHR